MEARTTRDVVDEVAVPVAVLRADDLSVESASAGFRALLGGRDVATLGLREPVRSVAASGELARHPGPTQGAVDERHWLLAPLAGAPGRVLAVAASGAAPGIGRPPEPVAGAEWELRQLSELLPQIVWRAGPDGTPAWASQRWYAYTGAPLGQRPDWTAVIHPEDRRELVRGWTEAVRAQGAIHATARLRRRDGAWRTFLLRADPAVDAAGAHVGWFGTAVDIEDERRAAEEREALVVAEREARARAEESERRHRALGASIRASEERLRMAVEAVGAGTWDLDLVSGELVLDALGRRLLGVPQTGELTYETLLTCLHAEDRADLARLIERTTAQREQTSWSVEVRVVGLVDGEARWLEARGRVHFAPDGQPRRIVGTLVDVSSERAVREAEHRYQRFRDVLVGVLGHDLRGPLAAIRMTAEMLLRRGALGSRETQMAERIVSSSARMGLMLRQIVELTRLRLAHTVPVELRPVELVDLCEEVVAEVRAARPEVHVALHAPAPVHGHWDPDRLSQVLTNLVTNAAGPQEAELEIHVGTDGQRARVEVHNAQVEIPEASLDTLFDPFAGNGSKPVGETGLGLGVFVAQQFARAHGGDVSVRSAPGRGTTFELVLPVAAEPARG